MRIKVTFTFEGKLTVPIYHQVLIHGLIYNSIQDKEYREHLHNVGFAHGKRQFRMFCYSKLSGAHELTEDKIVFRPPVSFILSAYDEKLIQEFVTFLFTQENATIGAKKVKIKSIEQIDEKISERMWIQFITPVTMYSTVFINGKRKTYFYSPTEREFSELIEANARKKYQAVYENLPENLTLQISPKNKKGLKQKTVRFKDTLIKGWVGDFILEGSKELLQIVYDVGLGSKCSNGNGLFKIIRHLERGEITC